MCVGHKHKYLLSNTLYLKLMLNLSTVRATVTKLR